MSAGQQMPPWLQEQIGKLQQSQQSLQSIMAQKQQVEMDSAEADKALEELKKAGDDDQVFKHAGSILIKSTKNVLIESLDACISRKVELRFARNCGICVESISMNIFLSNDISVFVGF